MKPKKKYQNNQLWSECQMVSMFNAMRFYDMKNIPEMGTPGYKDICSRYHCLSGSCLKMDTAREELGLNKIYGIMSLSWLKSHLPAELSVFCHRGYHSVLAIEVQNKKVLLTNYARNRLYWMNWDTLIDNIHKKPEQINKR